MYIVSYLHLFFARFEFIRPPFLVERRITMKKSNLLKLTSLLVRVALTLLLVKMYDQESFIATLIISIPEFWNSLQSDYTKFDDAVQNDEHSKRQKELQVVIPFLLTFFLLLLLQPKNFDASLLKILISKSELILQWIVQILSKAFKKRSQSHKNIRNR